MSKIINFQDKSKYLQELKEIVGFLDDTEEELQHRMFVLATLDKWKEWSDKKETGATVEITKEMLQNAGDPNIDKLIELKEKVSLIKNEIAKA